MINEQVARTVRGTIADKHRPPEQWAQIRLHLTALREAVLAGDEDRIEQARRTLAIQTASRRVDPFGEDIDLDDDGAVPPEPGLHELVNSLLTDLGFPSDAPGEPDDR